MEEEEEEEEEGGETCVGRVCRSSSYTYSCSSTSQVRARGGCASRRMAGRMQSTLGGSYPSLGLPRLQFRGEGFTPYSFILRLKCENAWNGMNKASHVVYE